MEAEYVRRARADGKASADAWVREQGIRFRQKLVADGVCAAPGKADRSAAVGGDRKKREVRDKNGRVCTKTRRRTDRLPMWVAGDDARPGASLRRLEAATPRDAAVLRSSAAHHHYFRMCRRTAPTHDRPAGLDGLLRRE